MTKKIVWLVLSCLMALSLVIASCGSTEDTTGTQEEEGAKQEEVSETETGTETTTGNNGEVAVPSGEPEYGGTVTLALNVEPTWDLLGFGAAYPQMQAHQRLIDGNWSKGLAGGYGEGLTTWGASTNIPDLNTGYLADGMSWEISEDGTEVTTTFTLRDGIFFANVDSEAGRLVAGRKVTIDDLVWNWNQRIQSEEAQNYQLYPDMRYPEAVKTGVDTFSITHKYDDHLGAIMRENVSTVILPPELWDAYGYDSCTNWEYSVGTGPYILTDYVVGNMVKLDSNPNYWMTDPVGPGLGNKLPYAEKVKYIIMIDESTRQAALRTGNLDQMGALTPEEKDDMVKRSSDLMSAARGSWGENPLFMRTDIAPFNDSNVRKALMLATDFQGINEGLYDGLGNVISWPYFDVEGYEPLYVSLDDADCPDSVKELYSYNPDKARQLMSDAGYPNGFKTTVAMQQIDVDYYSILADMWSKIGVELHMQPLEFGALISTAATVGYDGMIAISTSPNSSYPEQSLYAARNWVNASVINEPYVNDEAEKIRALAIDDFQASMELCRPLVMHLLEQAYMIPTPRYPTYTVWWPWIKNYNGETSVGYFPGDSWTQWVWVDQDLKTEMGY